MLTETGGKLYYAEPGLIQNSKTPLSTRQLALTAWIRAYVHSFCDKDPGSDKVFAPVCFRKDIYDAYLKSWDLRESTMGKPLDDSLLYTLLRDLFPNVRLRDGCNITGTCTICGRLEEGTTSGSGDTVISEALRIAHVLHRPYYAGARAAYHDRVEHYFRYPTRIFSLAIDIMESMKLQLPYAGSQTQLTNTVDSNFVGVLVHGEYLKFYRTANTVTKSASLIIHCFLSELDLWIERQQGRMPDITYLQVDGGSENANKYMLGMIELLCVKRISRTAIYSRLPSAHSHDDQDGTFGTVKTSLKRFPMMTWDSFIEKIKDCFGQGSSKLKVVVRG